MIPNNVPSRGLRLKHWSLFLLNIWNFSGQSKAVVFDKA